MEWKKIEIHGIVYIITTSVLGNSWKVLMTNLVEIWTETLSKDSAMARCQSLNLLLDPDSFDSSETLGILLKDIPKHATEKSLDEIKLETSIDGIPFKFSINLTKGTPEQLWNEVTKPLCQASMELHRRHKILLDLIQKKDKEISEYKLSGAQLTRKCISTLPYDKEMFGNEISIHDSKSDDCVDGFQSMMDLYDELRNRESISTNASRHMPQESSVPKTIKTDEKELKREMTPDINAINDSEVNNRLEIETTVPISRTESTKTEIDKQCGTSVRRACASQSGISLPIKENSEKKRLMNNLPSSKNPKRTKIRRNIYDFIA